MRLTTFADADGARLGVVDEAGALLFDVGAHASAPTSMAELLSAGEAGLDIVRRAVDGGLLRTVAVADVTLLPPVPRPGVLLCIGYNYWGHGDGAGAAPEYPDVFGKAPQSLIGPDQPIVLPPESSRVDYEGELGVVIGTPAHRVDERDALKHVAGYTIVNDVSARDVQGRGSQWTLGKSFDTFGPMGPWLTTADEVPDPQALEITVTCHDQVTVRSSTAQMIRSVAFLVSYLSQTMTLRPGDVIATGTPGKLPEAGAADRYLASGDEVSVTYGHLGTLTSPVTASASPATPEPTPQER